MVIGGLPIIPGQHDTDKMDGPFSSSDVDGSNVTEEYTPIIEKFKESLLVYDQLQNYVLIFTYVPLFLIALTSNVLVILVVSRYRCLRRFAIFYLVHYLWLITQYSPVLSRTRISNPLDPLHSAVNLLNVYLTLLLRRSEKFWNKTTSCQTFKPT